MKIALPTGSSIRSPEFVFGVATSAFQIEGAADTRRTSIWDTFCDTPGKISDRSNGKIACDHLARADEDIDLIASLGVDAYRFSVSWPRVLRNDGSLDQQGVDFYVRLLDGLRAKNIKPFVTLYHWDLPQYLEDNGGWLNRETAYRFRDYANQVSRAFGDRVHSYATLNEPYCSAYLGYEMGIHAPGRTGKSSGKQAAHHLLLGHGLAMQVLKANSPHTKNGIVLNFAPCYPATTSATDIEAARLADEIFNQWYIKPVMDGDYPACFAALGPDVAPAIEDGDLDIISHDLDYLGVNYYTRAVYRADAKNGFTEVAPTPPLTDMGWEVYPQGLTDLLLDLHSKYDLPPIYITESGAAMPDVIEGGQVNDIDRIRYLDRHLGAINDAMEKGVRIDGFFYWSLMDNFEWAKGYEKRFGIVYVDYATQQRTIKASGRAYRDMLMQRKQQIPAAG